jgi:hypothetical protein
MSHYIDFVDLESNLVHFFFFDSYVSVHLHASDAFPQQSFIGMLFGYVLQPPLVEAKVDHDS